jgi:hypothetical protein
MMWTSIYVYRYISTSGEIQRSSIKVQNIQRGADVKLPREAINSRGAELKVAADIVVREGELSVMIDWKIVRQLFLNEDDILLHGAVR